MVATVALVLLCPTRTFIIGAQMKSVLSLTLAFATILLSTLAHAKESVQLKGALQITELTVVKEGVQATYAVPVALSSEVYFSQGGTSLAFGRFGSRCPPYIGNTFSELRIPISNVTASVYDEKASQSVQVDVSKTGTVVIPTNARVFGTCGGDGKTLRELTIQTDASSPIRFEAQ